MSLPSAVSDALPQASGFLRNYVEYACACSDAPPVFHAGVSLTVLASAIAHKVRCPWSGSRVLMPNLYTLIVGPSRTARKTTATDAGTDMIYDADDSMVIPIPGSYEELIAQLRRQSHGVLTFREFGHFLKQTSRGYAEPQRTALMDLYDWPHHRPYTRNLKKGTTIIQGPICLSLLASISNELLFQYVDTAEWLGGFFGRMLLIYGERDEFKMPQQWLQAHHLLTGHLRQFAGWDPPPCGGFHPTGWEWFTQWCQIRDQQRFKLPTRVQNFASGVATFAAKIALLYALDSGEPVSGDGWVVSPESLYRATQFIDNLYLKSAIELGDKIQFTDWERYRQRALDIIDASGEIGITHRDLLRKLRVLTNQLEEIIETLRAEQAIELINNPRSNEPTYRRAYRDNLPPTGLPHPMKWQRDRQQDREDP